MKLSTTKCIVIFCLVNGVLWVWCSYLLAYLGRAEIAENLSKLAITEIIGVILIYCCKALFENLAKHNDWLDKTDTTSKAKKQEVTNNDTDKV